ncbi:5'-deoxynucleotidase HDDC2 [Chrysoperla carnea]|uniref:5'-deoxynucleotidase HDDC2 n=1 Tax=Chrysoperla carnea TaxID=189513 RepID=UPI001D080080|nr:5'-deoxynucleotidase HDDC2 [Chrysoperla carnea]
MSSKEILSFLELVGQLKHLKREGWVIKKIDNCETVSGHMYRMAMCTFLLDEKSQLNRTKCLELALVHDLAESIIGDITPNEGIPPDVKHQMELEAMRKITKLLPKSTGDRIMELFEEYESRETDEAKFVKELDYFDMVQQAYEYEKSTNVNLQEFFTAVEGKFSTPLLVNLKMELDKKRAEIKSDENIE